MKWKIRNKWFAALLFVTGYAFPKGDYQWEIYLPRLVIRFLVWRGWIRHFPQHYDHIHMSGLPMGFGHPEYYYRHGRAVDVSPISWGSGWGKHFR